MGRVAMGIVGLFCVVLLVACGDDGSESGDTPRPPETSLASANSANNLTKRGRRPSPSSSRIQT